MRFIDDCATVLETEKEYRDVYLDWVNNFLTVEKFATYYGWSKETALQMIAEGRDLHERFVSDDRKRRNRLCRDL